MTELYLLAAGLVLFCLACCAVTLRMTWGSMTLGLQDYRLKLRVAGGFRAMYNIHGCRRLEVVEEYGSVLSNLEFMDAAVTRETNEGKFSTDEVPRFATQIRDGFRDIAVAFIVQLNDGDRRMLSESLCVLHPQVTDPDAFEQFLRDEKQLLSVSPAYVSSHPLRFRRCLDDNRAENSSNSA